MRTLKDTGLFVWKVIRWPSIPIIGLVALALGYASFARAYGEIATLENETAELRLSDGAVARLSSGATLLYPKEGGRYVQLQGQAEMSVPRMADGYFVLETRDARIETSEGRFRVDARDGRTLLNVQAGDVVVRVYGKDGALSVPVRVPPGAEARVVAKVILGVTDGQ